MTKLGAPKIFKCVCACIQPKIQKLDTPQTQNSNKTKLGAPQNFKCACSGRTPCFDGKDGDGDGEFCLCMIENNQIVSRECARNRVVYFNRKSVINVCLFVFEFVFLKMNVCVYS